MDKTLKQEIARLMDDNTLSDAIYIVANRELNGEDAIDYFIKSVTNIIQGQTLTQEESK